MGDKIGNIAKLSGIPATTIRYYVKEGLLPIPVKINKKMCHYDGSCIERIKAIQKLQEKRFSLSVIKNILRRMDEGIPLEDAAALEEVVFATTDGTNNPLIDRTEFIERTGLTPDEVRTFEKIGLLIPFGFEKGKALYNQEDVQIGKIYFKKIPDLGLIPKDFEFYITLGRQIIENEMMLRKKMLQKKAISIQENIKLTADLTKTASLFRGYILRRLFQKQVQDRILKKQKLQSIQEAQIKEE